MTEGEYINSGPEGRERVLDRFYHDVERKHSNNIDLMICAEQLMLNSDLGISQNEVDIRLNEIFSRYDIDMPFAEKLDRMMALPVELLGDYVDTQLSRDEASDWYAQFIGSAKANMNSVHTTRCLTYEAIAADGRCEYSPACPRKIIGSYLERTALYGYDTEYEEIMGPLHDDYDLGRVKLKFAINEGFVTKKNGEALLQSYYNRYIQHMRSFGRLAIEAPKKDDILPPEEMYP